MSTLTNGEINVSPSIDKIKTDHFVVLEKQKSFSFFKRKRKFLRMHHFLQNRERRA